MISECSKSGCGLKMYAEVFKVVVFKDVGFLNLLALLVGVEVLVNVVVVV